jgi:hypothetical protein
MFKMLSALVAIFVVLMVALPGAADAAQRQTNWIRNLSQNELSARRYVRRYHQRYYYYPHFGPDYYGPPRQYYYRPTFEEQPYLDPYYRTWIWWPWPWLLW